eukprot:56769-Hanusia_phi.AAC.1
MIQVRGPGPPRGSLSPRRRGLRHRSAAQRLARPGRTPLPHWHRTVTARLVPALHVPGTGNTQFVVSCGPGSDGRAAVLCDCQ